ncbi:MAG: putative rane protein [Herbinix sp.]|jgi:hypothetical protein|nr:putative rane protein [Herbinix sp.]
MLKHVYRIIILIIVFVAAFSYFSGDIKEVVFDVDNTTTMEATTFPLVKIKINDGTINLLHGYSSNLDANQIRESVTPLDPDQAFEVQIDYKEYDIKKMNYEVREFVGNSLIETSSVSVFEEDGADKTAKVKLQAELESGKEYALKLTLITSKSEKMYYYQRIKIYEQAYLKENLDFALEFHKAMLDKTEAESMIKYIESSKDADNSSFAYVNIFSSFDMISWGNLNPTVITTVIPTIKEIYPTTASIELNYIVEAEINGVAERFNVSEFFRVKYSSTRMFLLNYERHMESMFDISLASLDKNELKLGITENLDVPYIAGEDETKIAFVRNRELWFYDLTNNEITKVFSFKQENTDYIRDVYDQHDIRILSMDAEGNMNFMVYGYMNRGQYEGKVAIILYHYIRSESRIEELVYIPVEEPYQKLKENLGELSYVNTKEIFYFQVNQMIYSYNLITKKLSEIAKDVNKNQLMVLEDINYIAWQQNSDPRQSDQIYLMDLETGNQDIIKTKEGYNIRLMDKIDSNIIYGYVEKNNFATLIDGSLMAPLSMVEIASVDKKILKSYQKQDYYISGIAVKDNIVELRRVQKVAEENKLLYTFAPTDYIMNQEKEESSIIHVSSRVPELALTEYYLSFPAGFEMYEIPKVKTTVNTIIAKDPTVRLPEDGQMLLAYYPYITGGIEGSYENAADAIQIAKAGIGVVLNSNNQLVWERGVKETTKTINEFVDMTGEALPNKTLEACIQRLLEYQNIDKSLDQLSVQNSSVYDILKKYSRYTPIRLSGVELDDVLYYVSLGRPVIAMTNLEDAVVIYGYDTFNIMVYNPAIGKTLKMGIQDSAQTFKNAGNVFLSYLYE